MQEALRFGSQHATNAMDGDVEATQRMAAQAEQVAKLLARAENKPDAVTKEAVMAGAISPIALGGAKGDNFFNDTTTTTTTTNNNGAEGRGGADGGGAAAEEGGENKPKQPPVVFDSELFRDLEATGILPVVQVGDGPMLSRPTMNEVRRAMGYFKVLQADGTLVDAKELNLDA